MQVREEYSLTKGRVVVRGKLHTRGQCKRADYVLFAKPNIPIAVIEAKDATHSLGAGMQQGLGYAELLDVPFVFSSNGTGFLFHNKISDDGVIERELPLDEFPSPQTLWGWYTKNLGLTALQDSILTEDYHSDGTGKEPRYYQLLAINKATRAIAEGRERVLLVMATGTGKTYTAFQLIWRLWKSGTKKRILFLADRNILIDQTMTNDFKPFGSAMTKIGNRRTDKSYEIYLSLYQAVTGSTAAQNIYKQFSADFFDLIVVDECHRGSAAENSAWRDILDYFSSATQVGLTATPKETSTVSNTEYFGAPVYTYSLRQGIEDGFLAPYKVIRIELDKDLEGWRPEGRMLDKYGNEIEDRIYNQRDFDRSLILEKRTKLVAKKIAQFLTATNPYDKTIVFCENIEHAERMRQALANESAKYVSANSRYVMRITGDSAEGKAELDNFIFPESRYPVIATTSKLMTTGVDAQTCKLIVLDQRIQSITEFKQIIGRGTRINEEFGKFYFTIMDFRKATELFADPSFDGHPVQVFEPTLHESPVPPDLEVEVEELYEQGVIHNGEAVCFSEHDSSSRVRRYYVGTVEVSVLAERVQYYNSDGKLTTESLKDYSRKKIATEFSGLEDFLQQWSSADRKQAIVDALANEGIFFEALADEIGRDYDPFDLVCHVAWDRPALTRKQRAETVKTSDYFTRYGPRARGVLDALLEKYADQGVGAIEETSVLTLSPFRDMGTPVELVREFGGLTQYRNALKELEQYLYSA